MAELLRKLVRGSNEDKGIGPGKEDVGEGRLMLYYITRDLDCPWQIMHAQ